MMVPDSTRFAVLSSRMVLPAGAYRPSRARLFARTPPYLPTRMLLCAVRGTDLVSGVMLLSARAMQCPVLT
eukprot:2446688-Rhodomonas_salina.1